jgi:hypothetical protein
MCSGVLSLWRIWQFDQKFFSANCISWISKVSDFLYDIWSIVRPSEANCWWKLFGIRWEGAGENKANYHHLHFQFWNWHVCVFGLWLAGKLPLTMLHSVGHVKKLKKHADSVFGYLILWNISNYPWMYMVLKTIRWYSKFSPLQEPQTSILTTTSA